MKKIRYYSKMFLIPLLLIIITTSCDERIGVTSPKPITVPTVSSTSPANVSNGVNFGAIVTATFSEAMNSSTITTATFTLMQGTAFVSGTVSYSGIIATFTPSSNLAANTSYTATITTGAQNEEGSALTNNYVWSFTTNPANIVSPTINSTDPVNAATNVPLNQKIAATFSVAMDASTITTSTFTLLQGTTPITGFVSYSGTTAIFAPLSNLAANTIYTATITSGTKNLAGTSIANNYAWSFTTGASAVVTPPTIISTDPANAAISVALNKQISANFSVAMDASTITTSTFTLMQGTTAVPGFVSYSGTIAIFTPASNLAPNILYTATITSGAKNLAGIALANNYAWSFTTGASAVVTPPTIISTDPANAAISVALNKQISANFSVAMDASTITTSTFTLMQGTTAVSGFVSYSGTTAIFTPASNLAPNILYTATITSGAKNLTGIALANNYVWSFTTGAIAVITSPIIISTDPVNAATNVPVNQKIAATFSMAMDASTITTSTFTLLQGTTPITGSVSYSGTTAIFSPSGNLASNTAYTALISTGAKNLAGTAMANFYTWSFTTGAAAVVTSPIVISTDPVNAATDVPFNQKIAATFSKTMDASTITTTTFTLMQGTTSVSGLVSYSGITAIFSPASNLLPTTTYTATISVGAKDLAGNALLNNYVWNFKTGAAVIITPPTVTSTTPINAEIGVAFNQKITATFSKTMDALTITSSTFTLMQGTTTVSGLLSYSGTTATFVPASNLLPNTTYTATITTGAKDLAGNALANNHVWSFTTATLYSVLLSSNPLAGGTTIGGGTFNSNTLVTVFASPNTGYTFTDWTENGSIVSSNASYSFTIIANRTLAANFASVSLSVNLGAAATFGGFGGSAGMTNQGIFTVVNGDIGTTAAATLITGFHDTGGNIFTETPLNVGKVNGVIDCAPPAPGTQAKYSIALQALADATAAFNYLAGLPGGSDPGAGELGGLVLAPGTYTAAAGTFKITSGDLTLDAKNNPNAVWVFQIATSLTVGKAGQPRSIILVNGAQAKNIFWQVGSAATINGAGGGTMAGTIISYSGVTFSTAGNVTLTTLNGRALSLNASVTLVNTVINVQ